MSLSELFQLVDCVPTPIFVLDVRVNGPPVYAHYNREALRRLRRPLSDFLGRTTAEAFGPEYGNAAIEEQLKTIERKKVRRYEFKLPFEGDLRIVRTTLSPQFNAAGEVIRLIGSAEDVSAEWIADAARDQIKAVQSDMEQFINMAAHDLRTPMRNVSGLTDLLRDGFEDHGDGKMELLDLLDDTAEKAMELIADVLAHANTVTPEGSVSLFDLRDLAEDIRMVLDPQRKHTLDCTEMTLNAERTTFQIVLRNLMENAIKHGGSDHLQITCRARAKSSDMIEVTLSDNGGGFSNPGVVFLETGDFRVDSGYGLLGIRRLVHARGGSISASNDPQNGGSTVRFTLPGRVYDSDDGVVQLPQAQNAATRKTVGGRQAD